MECSIIVIVLLSLIYILAAVADEPTGDKIEYIKVTSGYSVHEAYEEVAKYLSSAIWWGLDYG